jgi:hypothetical protein
MIVKIKKNNKNKKNMFTTMTSIFDFFNLMSEAQRLMLDLDFNDLTEFLKDYYEKNESEDKCCKKECKKKCDYEKPESYFHYVSDKYKDGKCVEHDEKEVKNGKVVKEVHHKSQSTLENKASEEKKTIACPNKEDNHILVELSKKMDDLEKKLSCVNEENKKLHCENETLKTKVAKFEELKTVLKNL